MFAGKTVIGLDLRDGEKPDWNKTGIYSTHLFTQRAQKIITDHARNTPDKVGTFPGLASVGQVLSIASHCPSTTQIETAALGSLSIVIVICWAR